jgi:predicted ribosomally synthesized peptide with SipW-like signal peptide
MKKIIFSASGIVVVAALAIASTGAFFSDTEKSTGNTFTAGAIDLKVDSTATYNGAPYDTGTWGQVIGDSPVAAQGLDITNQKFFDFADVKPGDSGEDTISLHVINNDAWLCASVSNLTNLENGQTEPEALVDQTTGTNQGELQQAMVWKVWRDDGAGGGIPGDNKQNGAEQTLASGHPVNGTLAVYDSTTGAGPLLGGTTGYLGVSWSLPSTTGNEVQTDSMTGDISFNVVQSRNNANFKCNKEFVLTDPSEQNALNTVSKDKPWYTYNINGLCIDFTYHNPTYVASWPDFQIDGDPGTYVSGLSNIIITQGPFAGKPVGNLYSDVKVDAGQTATITKCGNSEIKMGVHYGGEQEWDLDWATFTAQ